MLTKHFLQFVLRLFSSRSCNTRLEPGAAAVAAAVTKKNDRFRYGRLRIYTLISAFPEPVRYRRARFISQKKRTRKHVLLAVAASRSHTTISYSWRRAVWARKARKNNEKQGPDITGHYVVAGRKIFKRARDTWRPHNSTHLVHIRVIARQLPRSPEAKVRARKVRHVSKVLASETKVDCLFFFVVFRSENCCAVYRRMVAIVKFRLTIALVEGGALHLLTGRSVYTSSQQRCNKKAWSGFHTFRSISAAA